MNYLVNKKNKQKRFYQNIFFVLAFCFLFYFRVSIFNGLSSIGIFIFRPVIIVGHMVGDTFGTWKAYFLSKSSLLTENQNLQSQIKDDNVRMANYNSLLSDNENFKEILGRKNTKINMTVSAVLAKPNQSLYDTLLIDAGIRQGIKIGGTVFAFGDIPIGRVAEIYDNDAKVVLFSNPGERIQVIAGKNPARPDDTSRSGGVFAEAVGRGGGNFEMVMPKDLNLLRGDEVVLPGITPYVLGIVQTIISDPRDPFIKALLTSPVNVQELKFVQVGL